MTSEGGNVDKDVPIVDVVTTTDGAAELEKTGFGWVVTRCQC